MPGSSTVLVHVSGVVQGVGFRPFVHRLALRHELDGWVRNESGEVEIALSGAGPAIDGFLQDLRAEAPPLCQIEDITLEPTDSTGVASPGFRIVESGPATDRRQPVPPDVAVCEACLAEMLDPANRRYRYPFITCTDCGPRYTVIEGLPYDRERTSMRVFTQCGECAREYSTPGDRRHHSETNSCGACGPRLEIVAAGLGGMETGDPLRVAAAYLRSGHVVALRGLGGFHLAVDATDEAAVARLRERKRRDAKPLAVMVRDMDEAVEVAEPTAAERAALQSPERPIVLVRRKGSSAVAETVAPSLDRIGVMLAYTPMHHLLLAEVGRPLVMTSGNLSEEPIAASTADALDRLGSIADAFLVHDREIVAAIDDSVVRLAGDAPVILRRARGLAPLPVAIPIDTAYPVIAVGGHLKNTFTLARGRRAYVSPHIGDLESIETLEHFGAVLGSYERLFSVRPEVAARDMHPGYLSTKAAGELDVGRVIAVQHHHAHIVAVAAENGCVDPVIGIAFDGTGYGDDGNVWGAEVMISELHRYRRVAQLRYSPLPGGDAAVKSPWRSALGYLSLDSGVDDEFESAFAGIPENERANARLQIDRGVNTPLASSMGRLFDAAAAVLGVRRVARYEGQAAMELEALAADLTGEALPFPFTETATGYYVLDPLPLLSALGCMLRRGRPPASLAADFHTSVEESVAAMVARIASQAGIRTIALGGGSFQNARLVSGLCRRLSGHGLRVLTPRRLPCNDGGLSYGQAVVAAAIMAREG